MEALNKNWLKKKKKRQTITDTDELGAFVQYPEEGTDATDHRRPSALQNNTTTDCSAFAPLKTSNHLQSSATVVMHIAKFA